MKVPGPHRLTRKEWRRLGGLERAIAANLGPFHCVLDALAEVRRYALWAGTHGSYDSYVNARTRRPQEPPP